MYVVFRKEKGGDKVSDSSVCNQTMKFLSIFLLSSVTPFVFLPVLCISPSLTSSTFQNYFPLSVPHFFSSPSLSLNLCSPLYVSSLPVQTGLLSFTIGPRLEGWQTHKGSASLLGAAKKLKEGIVETQHASALHQPRHASKKLCI